MRGRKIFREPLDPYLAPPEHDPPEPPEERCGLCHGEGYVGTGLSDSFVDGSDAMLCPDCGGTGVRP